LNRTDARARRESYGAISRGAPIDLIWITHQHSDHIGGDSDVLGMFKFGTYVDNGRDPEKAEARRRVHEVGGKRGAARRVVDPEHLDLRIANSPEVRLTAIVPPSWPWSCAQGRRAAPGRRPKHRRLGTRCGTT
jgi:glyoxylase-like metal-dependent hydrolase (beta-lactamase superfamily II)